MTTRTAICLSLVLASHAARASGTCAVGQTTNDKVVTPNYNGIAQSWNVARLDTTGHVTPVTVYDYRKCAQSGESGAQLDGAIVANSLALIVPTFEPDGLDAQYRVYAPDPAHQNHKLLIYMAGEGASNADKDELLQRAAYLGYHVIATRYWNNDDAGIAHCGMGPAQCSGDFCPHSPANPYTDTTAITYDQCITRLHRNQFENWSTNFTTAHIGPHGARCVPGSSSDTDVCNGTTTGNQLDNGDTTKYRARALLDYLEERHPGDGWDQFSPPGHPGNYDDSPYFDWSTVAVMGHSTGSKVAFYLQHDQADLDRVILLSGPNLPASHEATTQPGNLASYVTTPSAVSHARIYAFSNTNDPKFADARATWRFMEGPAGEVGLAGSSASGGWESAQPCTSGLCPVCRELRPVAPPAGSSIRAIQYSGNAELCVGKSSPFVPIDGGWAHDSTTSDSSCGGSTPDSCWYLAIWDYMLTN